METTKVNNSQNYALRTGSKGNLKLKQILNDYFEFAPNGYLVLDIEGVINEVKTSAEYLMGLSKDSIINTSFANYIITEDQSIFINCRLKLIETSEPQVCLVRIFPVDGHKLWLRLNLSISEYDDESQILVTLTDITLEKNIEEIQSFLMDCSWVSKEKDFFQALAEYLANKLGMDYVFIDKLVENNLEAQTVAVYSNGRQEDNIRYTLEDTPCGKVVGQTFCCYPSRVRYLFPEDQILKDMAAESYSGIILRGSNGKTIGLIALVGRKPIADTGLIEAILRQASIRAASELEHRQLEEKIIRSHHELEVTVKERTKELQRINEVLRKEILKRKQNEKSLLIAEEKYRTVADFTYDWETWVGDDGKFIYVSPSCKPTTGYEVEEFMNDPSLVIKITHPDDREIVENHYNEKRMGHLPGCSLDFRIITRSGEERWIGHSCQPVFNSKGKWIGQRGSNRDITASKNAEQVLIASQIELRALTRRMDVIAEGERARIAREIHDELGHILTVLKYDIEGLANNPDLTMEDVKNELNIGASMIDSMIDTVRTITSDLRPGILDHMGLIPSIEWQMEQFQKRTGIICDYDIQVIDEPFSKNETTVIFRILQEILTNVARHSRAKKVTVSLTKRDKKLKLLVKDNGIGFDLTNSNHSNSLGILGMRERALSIGGELEIDSNKGKGTQIIFWMERN